MTALTYCPGFGGGVDLVVTSPPYNLGASPWPELGGATSGGHGKWRSGPDGGAGGIDYADHHDALPWPEYVAWQRSVLSLLWGVLDEAGAIFYNHKNRVIGTRLWTPFELVPPEVTVRQEIIWQRAGGMNPNPTAYMPTHERILVLAREAWRLKSRGASAVGDVWRIAQETSPHPAPFPVGLPARAIETTGARTVLDPFSGSGSTLRAAKDAGVHAIGIERSERYCELAIARLAQEVLPL